MYLQDGLGQWRCHGNQGRGPLDFSSALGLVVGKLNDWLSLVFFLGAQGAPHIPVGAETFSSCQVCWSSEATNLFGRLEKPLGKKKASVCRGWGRGVTKSTRLLSAVPREGGGECL